MSRPGRRQKSAPGAGSNFPLAAVNVGNSRVKLGLFPTPIAAGDPGLPRPSRALELVPSQNRWDAISHWLAPLVPADVSWWIGSVQREHAASLRHWLVSQGAERIKALTTNDLPLVLDLPQPEKVGIDRLLGALAANRIRPEGMGAVIVDLGTAITVNVLSATGTFTGGAILPGIGMSARALHEFTDLLPLVEMADLDSPPAALGKDTTSALRSGLFWGSVGGIKQLIEFFSEGQASPPRVYLTGGAAPAVAGWLGFEATFDPHLTLSGIALAAGG